MCLLRGIKKKMKCHMGRENLGSYPKAPTPLIHTAAPNTTPRSNMKRIGYTNVRRTGTTRVPTWTTHSSPTSSLGSMYQETRMLLESHALQRSNTYENRFTKNRSTKKFHSLNRNSSHQANLRHFSTSSLPSSAREPNNHLENKDNAHNNIPISNNTQTKERQHSPMYVLGIETSCDDCGIAVVSSDGRVIGKLFFQLICCACCDLVCYSAFHKNQCC